MSKYSVQSINYISSGAKEKFINLNLQYTDNKGAVSYINNITYVLNIEEQDDVFRSGIKINRSAFKDLTNNRLVHNIYPIEDMCMRSAVKRDDSGSNGFNNTDNFIENYGPQLDNSPIQFTKFKDTTYILTDEQESGNYIMTTNLQDKRDSQKSYDITDAEYSWKYQRADDNTYVYGPAVYSDLEKNFKVRYSFGGIKHNYLIESPQDSDDYNDFENGDIQADTITLKNVFDSSYSMSMAGQTALRYCRSYCGIGECGNKLYLKYYDNIRYDKKSSEYDSQTEITNVQLSSTYMNTSSKYPFQKIETVKSINRFRSVTAHKSNLYSIELVDTGLNYQTTNQALKVKLEKLKNDIRNNIMAVTKNICPVETQLFNIYFRGE